MNAEPATHQNWTCFFFWATLTSLENSTNKPIVRSVDDTEYLLDLYVITLCCKKTKFSSAVQGCRSRIWTNKAVWGKKKPPELNKKTKTKLLKMTPCQLAWPFLCHLFNIHFTLTHSLTLFFHPRSLTCLLAASWQERGAREIYKKREKGDIRAFQGKLMEDWTAQLQPQDTLSL